ncbi:MAG: sigma-70 family RNA polymerase sigma factor, partial [Thermodesulfobacteriota bacterium]
SLTDQKRIIKVPLYLLEQKTKIYRASSVLQKEMGRKPNPEEIAKKLKIPVRYVEGVLNGDQDVTSLDTPIIDGDQKTLIEFIVDEESLSPDYFSFKESLNCKMQEALTLLTPREGEIIRLRYGIDKDDRYTLDEVGKIFGVTRERIRQIENVALEKLANSKMRGILESFYI